MLILYQNLLHNILHPLSENPLCLNWCLSDRIDRKYILNLSEEEMFYGVLYMATDFSLSNRDQTESMNSL